LHCRKALEIEQVATPGAKLYRFEHEHFVKGEHKENGLWSASILSLAWTLTRSVFVEALKLL
jgi:hypothetical protein